jgi:hypothetical protein
MLLNLKKTLIPVQEQEPSFLFVFFVLKIRNISTDSIDSTIFSSSDFKKHQNQIREIEITEIENCIQSVRSNA